MTFGALSVERGGLLGLGLVGHLSLNTVLEAAARLLLCVGALWLGRGPPWVWLGWGGAYLVAVLAAWPVMRRTSKSPASGKFDRAAVWQYTVPVIAGTGLLALMMHVDMVFVGAFFHNPDSPGDADHNGFGIWDSFLDRPGANMARSRLGAK